MKKFVRASSDSALLYFEAYQLDNIGELVADNLTHKYRSEGADFYYVGGQQGYDYKSGKNSVTVRCRVSSHYDPEINKNSRYGAYLDGMDGKEFTAKHEFGYNRYDTQDTMGRQIVIILTDDIEDQIIKGSGVMGACDVKASTEPNFDVMKLTNQFFKDAKKIVEYFRYHNKNLNKRQDELLENLSDAIDSRSTSAAREAIENLKYNTKGMNKEQNYQIMDLYDELCTANGKYQGLGRSYKEDSVSACDKVTGATDITDEQVKFFYNGKFLGSSDPNVMDCDKLFDAMKSDKLLCDLILEYLNSFGDPIYPISDEEWDEPETDSGKVDTWHLYNTFMDWLRFEYREYPEDFYVDLSVPRSGEHTLEIFDGPVSEGVDLSSSTKYGADMCSIGASGDDDYEQLVELDKSRYSIIGYYDNTRSPWDSSEGSSDTDDFDEIIELAKKYIRWGDFVKITNNETSRSQTYSPSEWYNEVGAEDVPASIYELE